MIWTRRAVLLLLLAAPFLVLGTWAPALQWVALIYALLAALLTILDWRPAGPAGQFEVLREHDNRPSLGADNPIRLTVRRRPGREGRAATPLWVRDEPPEAFLIGQRILEGELPARGSWQGAY